MASGQATDYDKDKNTPFLSSGSKLGQSASILNAWDGFLGFSQFHWNLFFCFLVVFGLVGQNVSLPIWFASAPNEQGFLDPYFVLTFAGASFIVIFFIFTLIDIATSKTSFSECWFFTTPSFLIRCSLIGMCNGLNGLFLVFAAPPERTPTFLQAILGTFNIAWTILFRLLILHKVPTNMQLLWAAGVFGGLFVASMPSIFGFNTGASYESQASGLWKIMWPVIFASSFAPAAIMNVVGESVLKETSQTETDIDRDDIRNIAINDPTIAIDFEEKNVNIWYYLTIQSITQLLTFIVCFWCDAVKNFGTAKDIPDIFTSLKQDWRYFVALDGATYECTVRALVFILCYTFNYLGSSLMLRYTEGATWTAIVGALVTPLGAMFWFFFTITENNETPPHHFQTDIHWEWSNWLIIGGLIIMGPFIFLYDREVQKQEKEDKERIDFGLMDNQPDNDPMDHRNKIVL